MLVVVSFARRGFIQNFSSLGPLALLFRVGSGGRVAQQTGNKAKLSPAEASWAWAELGKNAQWSSSVVVKLYHPSNSVFHGNP